MVVCTRSEQEIRRKPGTEAEKWSSVPDLSGKSDGNRVQEKEKSILYPCGARSVEGEVCVPIKGVCSGNIEWYRKGRCISIWRAWI